VAIPTELDRGSYLSHYGLLSPWSIWLLQRAPEVLALTPSELRAGLRPRPNCPSCGQPMRQRPREWVCFYHEPPVRAREHLPVADVKWADEDLDVLALIGKDVDVVWVDDPLTGEKGYRIVPFDQGGHHGEEEDPGVRA
jgi:hypothetical protein